MISTKECKECCLDQIKRLGIILDIDPKPVLDEFEKEYTKGEIKTAPEYAEFIFNEFSKITGIDDPYRDIKKESNKEALRLLPMVHDFISKKYSGLTYSIETAIVGNMIDYGAFKEVNIEEFIKAALSAPYFRFDIEAFKKDLESSKTILYIADNAGEIFFDVTLLKHIRDMGKSIYFAVRGAPIINDVTHEDATFADIHECASIISTGAKIPGIVMSKCSKEFEEIFYKADMIISKGQGNFETLYISKPRQEKLYYLFVVKCKSVAELISAKINDKVLMKA